MSQRVMFLRFDEPCHILFSDRLNSATGYCKIVNIVKIVKMAKTVRIVNIVKIASPSASVVFDIFLLDVNVFVFTIIFNFVSVSISTFVIFVACFLFCHSYDCHFKRYFP